MRNFRILIDLIVFAAVISLTACNDSIVDQSKWQRQVLSNEKPNQLPEGNDQQVPHSQDQQPELKPELMEEAVNPPSNVTGTFLVGCIGEVQAQSTSFPNDSKIGLSCKIHREDQTLAEFEGLWSGQIMEPLPGETLAMIEPRAGEFELELKNSKTIANAFSRTIIIFEGKIDGMQLSLSTMVDEALNSEVQNQVNDLIKKIESLQRSPCPVGYVLVPGDLFYETPSFCVMKYEAKNSISSLPVSTPAGIPWVSLSQVFARLACQQVGVNYDLISNRQWLTIAANLTIVPINWSQGVVGSGSLNRGHSDNNPPTPCPASDDDRLAYVETDCTGRDTGDFTQKRTHTLSNGEVIWDFSGNVWDWTNETSDPTTKPFSSRDGIAIDGWRQYTELDSGFMNVTKNAFVPNHAQTTFWNDFWNSQQGIGQYYAGVNGFGGGFQRGGSWDDFDRAGAFAAGLFLESLGTFSYTGFRCVFIPQIFN